MGSRKKEVRVPVLGGGGLKTPAFCEKLLEQEKVDLVGLARPLLADPEWPNKSKEGRDDEIRLCISCYECMSPSAGGRQGARRCAVNAAMGREREFSKISPAQTKKRIMVVGGGPAGMEAARVATLRGHEVTLYERNSELGGNLLIASAAPGKDKILWVRDYLASQVKKLKVKIELNADVSLELVEKVKPDVVVLATGSTPMIPEIPGADSRKVINAWEVLSGKAKIDGEKVVVIGGSMVGCETGNILRSKGRR